MKRLVIDTDPGIDDAHAILLAGSHPDVKIEALTTLGGNVSLANTTANACKILDILNLDVPVYAGADGALLEREHKDAAHVHGYDGLGDANIPTSARTVEKEHAVHALSRLADENPAELTLVAIGPLTNIALATRLDPELPKKYKELIVMGGAIYAQGNTPNTSAEFNFYHDPEAAAIVFESWANITLLSWETTLKYMLSEELVRELIATSTPKGKFFNQTTTNLLAFTKMHYGSKKLFAPDGLAMAVAIEPSIVTKFAECYVQIECMGKFTRGQSIIDWRGSLGKAPNTKIVLELDGKRFDELMLQAVR